MDSYLKRSGRPRKHIKEKYGMKDTWVYYKNKTSDKPECINDKMYKEIIYGFLKYLGDKLLENGEVLFPERLGSLYIYGKKLNCKVVDNKLVGATIDWKSSKKLWEENEECAKNKQLVYFMNEHSNNLRYKTIWRNTRVLVPNKTVYKFILCRNMKRRLSKEIFNGKEYRIKV
jgi:hypothetical protein|nr:MAG TPA: hypothetical protein [Caudoviricetes sp.]